MWERLHVASGLDEPVDHICFVGVDRRVCHGVFQAAAVHIDRQTDAHAAHGGPRPHARHFPGSSCATASSDVCVRCHLPS